MVLSFLLAKDADNNYSAAAGTRRNFMAMDARYGKPAVLPPPAGTPHIPVGQIAAIDHTLGELENQLQGLISLDVDARRTGARMGPKSEAFCRQTITALRLYPQVVPPSIGVEAAHSDLDMLDQLRPMNTAALSTNAPFRTTHMPILTVRSAIQPTASSLRATSTSTLARDASL